jgi:hypothetical protein
MAYKRPIVQRTFGLAVKAKERHGTVKRNLRVTKWLSTTPAVGVCTACSKEFRVPMTALSKARDAQVNLQQQFDQHKCESKVAEPESER